MTMDVSLRLRLQNQLSREAKVAKGDLKGLVDEGKKLGTGTGADKLGHNIREVGREANRAEKPLRSLEQQARKLNTVKTDAAAKEVKALGRAAREASGDLKKAEDKLRNIGKVDGGGFEKLNAPAGRLNGTMGLLASSATGAMAGLMAFASVDNIIRGLEQMSAKFRDLDRDVASVAVTAEMRTPEAIARISKSNETLAIRYGVGQGAVNSARKTYAAAGIDLASQEDVLDPTLKAAKAGDSTGETMASAVIAAKQNLGVKDKDIPAALDMMAKGAKLGSFEVDAMAKNFPALGTMLAGTGRQGLGGWAELVALSQVVRMGSGSQDEAATNLQNLLSKLTSKDTVDNFEKKGVSLPKLKANAEKQGKPYMTAVMDEVMRLTGGDTFKIGELFGDQQAGLALKPLLTNRKTYDDFLSQILNNSAGTVDADYNFLRQRPKERADRQGAALEATGSKVGETYDKIIGPLKDKLVRTINPDYARSEDAFASHERLKNTDIGALGAHIAELEKRLAAMPKPKNGDMDFLAAGRMTLEQQIQQFKLEMDTAKRVQGGQPADRPLGADMSGAADKAMQGYNERLSAEGDRAVSIATEKAAEMQKALNFTAQPTIRPNFMPPSGAPAPAGAPSLLQPMSNRTTNYITSPNPQHAALRANRLQDRAIRQALARSLADTGRGLA